MRPQCSGPDALDQHVIGLEVAYAPSSTVALLHSLDANNIKPEQYNTRTTPQPSKTRRLLTYHANARNRQGENLR